MDSEFNSYGTFSRNSIIVIGLSYMLSELVFTGHPDGMASGRTREQWFLSLPDWLSLYLWWQTGHWQPGTAEAHLQPDRDIEQQKFKFGPHCYRHWLAQFVERSLKMQCRGFKSHPGQRMCPGCSWLVGWTLAFLPCYSHMLTPAEEKMATLKLYPFFY